MFLKLFHATVVVFLAIISIVLFAVLLTGLISIIESSMLGGGYGITAVSGGVSERLFRFLVIAGSLLVAGVFLLWRRRRLR